MASGAILVTANLDPMTRIPGWTVEDWSTPWGPDLARDTQAGPPPRALEWALGGGKAYGRETLSVGSGGVLAGGTRWWVACSKA